MISKNASQDRSGLAATSCQRFRASRYWPALDGLRAIAVVMVVAFHAKVPGFGRGSYGVQLFFALSGFLITTLLLRERTSNGGISLKTFYARRTARIFPAYYGTLLLYVLLTWRLERATATGMAFWNHLPAFLTYTTNWFVHARPDGGRVIFVFAWSLAVEEQFYIVWPSVIRWTRGLGVPILAALTLAFSSHFFTAIGLGCVFALLADDRRTANALGRVFSHSLTLWAAVAAVTVVTWHAMPPGVAEVVATVAVGALAFQPDAPISRVLAWGPLRYVGTVSYGIYLLHPLALHVVQRITTQPVFVAAVGGLLAILAASVSFVVLERPIQRWARSQLAKQPETGGMQQIAHAAAGASAL